MNLRGYTLLEMIVSVGVFSVVMLAGTGAYLTLIELNRQARATSDVVTNLSFAIDSMARNIRTGVDYHCNMTGTNCTSPLGTSFRFTDPSGDDIDYELSSSGQILATIDGVQSPITDPRITIDALNFYVRGVGTGDGIQPQVTVIVRGTAPGAKGLDVGFTIESGATQRLLDL
jgi:prepilin-type N-terminal cleavage/methylation domain-containing protein